MYEKKIIENNSSYIVHLEHYSSIDMLRIIACLFVIIIHVMTGDLINSSIDWQALTIHCIVADAVAIFFSITGFLWFRYDRSYKSILLNFGRKIAVPTIITVIVSQVFYKWINSTSWTFTVDLLSIPDLNAILNGIFQHNTGLWNDLSDIYWYVLEYAFICLWFPAIKAIVSNKNGERIILAVIFWTSLNLLIRDGLLVLSTIGIDYPLYTYTPVSIPVIMVLVGYIMFKRIQHISLKCSLKLSVFIYIFLIMMRILLQGILYKYKLTQMVFVRYDCGLSIFTVFSLYVLIWNINLSKYAFLSGILGLISPQTFTIYLIHYMIVRKSNAVGILEMIRIKINQIFPDCLTILYDLIAAILVFGLSLLISCVLSVIFGEMKNCWNKRNIV